MKNREVEIGSAGTFLSGEVWLKRECLLLRESDFMRGRLKVDES